MWEIHYYTHWVLECPLGCVKITLFWSRTFKFLQVVFRCTGNTLIFFRSWTSAFSVKNGASKMSKSGKMLKKNVLWFWWYHTHFFRNQKTITTMYLFFLYDKYFLSYLKINYFLAVFSKYTRKPTYFVITQKVIVV